MSIDISYVSPDALDTTRDVILDVRMHPGKSQIRGALRCDPKAMLKVDRLLLPLPHDRTIAVYADSDQMLEAIVERLCADGFKGAALEGGMEAWTGQGLPVEELTQQQPIAGEPDAGIGLL